MLGTSQRDNTVNNGDLVGRDKTEINNIYFKRPSTISVLNNNYKLEAASAPCNTEFLDSLQHYMQQAADPDVRGLAAKLNDADREDLIQYAEGLKERVSKKILRFQTSAAAQDILAYVMEDLHTRFQLDVRPSIQEGADRATVDRLIQERVIDPVLSSLEDNVLKLYPAELLGLIFFMGGNCHIRWDKC